LQELKRKAEQSILTDRELCELKNLDDAFGPDANKGVFWKSEKKQEKVHA